MRVEIEVTQDLLETVAEFLVYSENSATESMKTDYFDEAMNDVSFKDWVKVLLETMLYKDEVMTFLKPCIDEIYSALISNDTTKHDLKIEYDDLYEIYQNN